MVRQRFEDMVFDAFKDCDRYDNLKHQITRVRELMLNRHISFKRLSVRIQFEYCCTIAAIAANTASFDLNKVRIFSKPKEDNHYPLAMQAGFKEQEIIDIASNNFKRLK